MMSAIVWQAQAISINPMIPLFHKWQLAEASVAVEQAARQGHKHVQFCIAMQALINEQAQVQAIGLYRDNRDAKNPGNQFYPSDAQTNQELKGYLQPAFEMARRNNMEIAVLLHLNAHGDVKEWRNFFDFDPAKGVGSDGYEKAVILPTIEALEAQLPADWPVEISLMGEMGTSVFRYPQAWKEVVVRLKQRGKLTKLKLGLGFNYQGVMGRTKPAEINQEALKSLWNELDFIGVSMYQGVSVPPVVADFDLAMGLFVGEFNALGCGFPATKPIHFVEVGLGGGGIEPTGVTKVPAQDAQQAARAPYMGSPDPQQADPWASPELRQLRREYYSALCDYLEHPRQRFTVERAFLWSFGSWDPHGLSESKFADAEIVKRIERHNQRFQR